MNPFLMAFLRATSLILNDTVTKKTENNRLQNQQYQHSDNDDYNPVPEEISNITRQFAENIGFQIFKTKDNTGSLCYMITKFKGRELILRFPEYIDNLPVHIIGSEIFSYSNSEWVEEVYIPETVTLIQSHAFSHCTNLKEVHFSGKIPEMSDNCFPEWCRFTVISEKNNTIYDALHYYDYVIIDGYEKIKINKSCAWLLKYVDTCNIVFRDGTNTAIIPIIGNYKRYPDSLINERLKLYRNCIENTTTDGKFFDTGLYDENILNLLPSMKRKLDVCYYRLSSGYRLSQEHSEMYEKFVRKHAKKSVYRAIDTNDIKRLEWCKKLGLIYGHYNAVLEYAKRKDNADILNIIGN